MRFYTLVYLKKHLSFGCIQRFLNKFKIFLHSVTEKRSIYIDKLWVFPDTMWQHNKILLSHPFLPWIVELLVRLYDENPNFVWKWGTRFFFRRLKHFHLQELRLFTSVAVVCLKFVILQRGLNGLNDQKIQEYCATCVCHLNSMTVLLGLTQCALYENAIANDLNGSRPQLQLKLTYADPEC